MFSMGGVAAWKAFEHRGFVVSLEWIDSGGTRKPKPCLVIWPASNILLTAGVRQGAWCIARNALQHFVGFDRDGKCTGDPSPFAFAEARTVLGEQMGKDANDKFALFALVDCIVKGAELIHSMPVAPKHVAEKIKTEAMWEVSATNKATGQTLKEASI